MKICLLGSAPSSVHLAPFADESWQIWGCSPGAYPVAKRADQWFELHRFEPHQAWFSPDYVNWMAALKCPVHMIEPVPQIPTSVAYPKDAMIEAFGRFHFSSSLSWMFAMALVAIEQGPAHLALDGQWYLDDGEAAPTPEIGIWGVDMSATEEYGFQRSGCHHFIEIAQARGIKITVPPESDLLQPPPLYGLGEAHPMRIKLMARKAELDGKMAFVGENAEKYKTAWEQAVREQLYLQGASEDVQYILNTWCE